MAELPDPGEGACRICADNEAADRGGDPWLVARLATGYVRLARTQYFRGATFVAAKLCVREIHDLPVPDRATHLVEMATVSEARAAGVPGAEDERRVARQLDPAPALVAHPRHDDDPHPHGPIWEDLAFLRALWTGGHRPNDAERQAMCSRLLGALDELEATSELRPGSVAGQRRSGPPG